jgi:glycosyltransferase involved in cell wall biosynthesis
MDISVVIPTCNRKKNLLSLLQDLNNSSYKLLEIIIVDSGEDKLEESDLKAFKDLNIICIHSEKSVCIQRNIGIAKARASWIFVCDDDIEVPHDYLQKLAIHTNKYTEAGAVSGLVFQREENEWKAKYPVNSCIGLLKIFLFQLSIWGEINCKTNNFFLKKIKNYYRQKGNHISKAGWPAITDFTGEHFKTPVYGLGASLIKKEWLINSPYDEVLDRHGIGDNYGVAADFPCDIHVLTNAFVYHHQEQLNRLQRPLQYFRRTLALTYFIQTKKNLNYVKKRWVVWSLAGNLLEFIFKRDRLMIRAASKSIWITMFGQNPYYKAAVNKQRIVEPQL